MTKSIESSAIQPSTDEEDNPTPPLELSLFSSNGSVKAESTPPPEPLEPAATHSLLDLIRDVDELKEKADLPPTVVAFDRPGKTVRETLSSANAVERVEEKLQSQYTPNGKIVSVSPTDVPHDGKPVSRKLGSRRRRGGVQRLSNQITIQYSAPMIKLGAEIEPFRLRRDESKRELPEWAPTLTPAVDGRWTWIDPSTLQFEAETDFAGATTYQVEAPCGTQWSFSSEPPKITFPYVSRIDGLTPLLEIKCDLEVDWESQFRFIKLVHEDGASLPVRLVKVEKRYDGWVAHISPLEPLQPDSEYRLKVAAELVSKVGPNPVGKVSMKNFRTYGDFALVRHGEMLEARTYEKSPRWTIALEFNNPLDLNTDQAPLVDITPKLDELKIRTCSTSIQISGRSPGGHYEVSLAPEISDKYGQCLGERVNLKVHLRRKEQLFFPDNRMFAIQAHRTPIFTFFSQSYRGLFVRVHRVKAEDWPKFAKHRSRRLSGEFSDIGETGFIEFEYNPALDRIDLDLSPYLPGKTGHVVIQVSPLGGSDWRHIEDGVEATYEEISRFNDSRIWLTCWLQVTNLAPSHFTNFQSFTHLVLDSAHGKSIPVKSEFVGSNSGTANIFRYNSETAFLPTRCSTVQKKSALGSYIFTDRDLYRPGETVIVKAWFWEHEWPGAPAKALPNSPMEYVVCSSGRELLRGEIQLTPESSAHISFKLPKDMNLGTCSIRFSPPENQAVGLSFRVEEFRRPAFEVQIERTDSQCLEYSIRAESFSGAPLKDAAVRVSANIKPTNYRPSGWSPFRFGFHQQLWGHWANTQPEAETDKTGSLDETGGCSCRLELNQRQEGRTYSVELLATVVDLDRQRQTARHHSLLHPSNVFLGLRLSKRVFGPTEEIEVQYVVVDSEGQIVPEQLIEIRLKDEDSHYLTSSNQPKTVRLLTERTGCLEIQGQVRDDEGNPHFTRVSLYRLGCPNFPTTDQSLPLVLDKNEYIVGETARATFFTPHKGTAVLRMVRGDQKLLKQQYCEAGEQSMTFELTEEMRDGGTLYLDFVGPDSEGEFQTYKAEKEFPISLHDKKLEVEISSSKQQLGPGAELEVAIAVNDSLERPVEDAEVALLVVDEAILFAGGYRIPEPFSRLYPKPQDATFSEHLWGTYKMPDFQGLLALKNEESRRMMACSMALPPQAESENPFIPRTNFAPLAHFSPGLKTDRNGVAQTVFKMPESLSKFRITAVVLCKNRDAGYAESQVQVSRPLLIEPSFPRFLQCENEVVLPVTVRNQTQRELEVEVGMLAAGLSLQSPKAVLLQMPSHSSRIVSFSARVQDVDQATIRSIVRYGHVGDTVESTIPVYRAATTETVASCGELVNSAVALPVTWPNRAMADFGGLAVEFSTTALQGLDDAYRYILTYPFVCTEQLASKIAATAALKDYFNDYSPVGVPDAEQRKGWMKDWISDLAKRYTGKVFRFWPDRSSPTHYFASLFAHHALILAHQNGYDLHSFTLQSLRESLAEHPVGEGVRTPRTVALFASYRLWLQCLAGEKDNRRYDVDVEHADLDTWLFLLQSCAGRQNEGLRYLQNSTTETATTAGVKPKYPYVTRYSFGSLQRSNAWALTALLKVKPEHPLVSKLAKGLQSHRVQGRWRNTQENIFAILALADYFKTREAVVPNLRAGAWIGRKQFAGRFFRGREQTRHRWCVSPDAIRNCEPSDVVLESKGEGRLYHRTELSWAVACTNVNSLNRGFEITRSHEIVEGEGVFSEDTLEVQAGAKIRVTIRIKNTGPRYHVALVDPYPPGFEPLNPKLPTTEPTKVSNSSWPFYQMRDHQVEAFASYLPDGRHTFSYEVRAVTRGTFQLRASKIEEMYSPETFGHTCGTQVTVR